MEYVHHIGDETPFVLQEGAVMTSLGDGLRAAEIDVHRVDERLHLQRGFQQRLSVIGAKLRDQWSIFFTSLGRRGRERMKPNRSVIHDHRGKRAM